MSEKQQFPPGWDEARVREVLAHYEAQGEDEHFGIVAVDGAKARSKWMLADFYGRILVPPTTIGHDRDALAEAIDQLRQAVREHALKDVLVAIERTGRYHHTPRQAFAAAGFET